MMQSNPRRRPVEGGYARGQETRLRIIRTAIPLFGRLGFESASTREIAAEAGVNPPALQYYFDSKEGLYRACAEYITEQAVLAMDPALVEAERQLARAADAANLTEAYCGIVEALADHLLCDPRASSWSPLLAREQAGLGPAIAYPMLRDRFIDRFQGVCAEIVGRITGRAADDPQTLLRMLAINGQLVSFHIGRNGVMNMLGWSQVTPEHGELIKSVVIDHARALLQAEHRAAAGRRVTASDAPPAAAPGAAGRKGPRRALASSVRKRP